MKILSRMNIFIFSLLSLSSCFYREPVKVGFLDEISGSTGELAQGSRNGIILAMEEINAEGGINGRPFHLVIIDSKGNLNTLTEYADQLIDEDVIAILGCSKSILATTLYSYTNEKEMLLISPTASSEELSGQKDSFFRVQSSTAYDGDKLAKYIYYNKGIRVVDCFYDLSNRSFSESFYLHFQRTFTVLGGNIRNVYGYYSKESDLFSEMADIVDLESVPPEGYLIISSAIDAALIAQFLHTRDSAAPLFTSEWSSTKELLFKGGKYVEDLESISMYSTEIATDKNIEFVENYKERFGSIPSFSAALGYESMYLLFYGLKLSENKNLSLKEALWQISEMQGLIGTVKFDSYGDVSRTVLIVKVSDGSFRVIKEIPAEREYSF